MGQDITQLTVLAESAAPEEQRRARKLLPVRRKVPSSSFELITQNACHFFF